MIDTRLKTVLTLSNEQFNSEFVAKIEWDANIHKMADMYYGLLRSAGYTHHSVSLILDCEETYEYREELKLKGVL